MAITVAQKMETIAKENHPNEDELLWADETEKNIDHELLNNPGFIVAKKKLPQLSYFRSKPCYWKYVMEELRRRYSEWDITETVTSLKFTPKAPSTDE